MTTLAKRLDTHFAACTAAAAGAAILGGAETADAAVVYSGVVNISVPNNINGTYLNMVSGAFSGSGATTPGYDTNPYYGGRTIWTGPADIRVVTTTAGGSTVVNLANGSVVGAGSTWGGHGVMSTLAQWTVGGSGVYGVEFQDQTAGNAIRYGWVRLIREETGAGSAGKIVEYAYEDTGGSITVVPGPGSLALLALGVAGMRGRRRVA